MVTTWKKEIKLVAKRDKIIFCTLTKEELAQEFENGFGGENGIPFTAWSEEWVYFPICYDGSEWVGRVPRNPCGIKMKHQGGG